MSRFETFEHDEAQYAIRIDDLCVPRSFVTHLGTQRSITLSVRRKSMCSKVSVRSDGKMRW